MSPELPAVLPGRSVPLPRRDFVAACASACAALMLGGCVAMVTHPVPVTAGRVRIRPADYPDLATPLGAIRIQPAGMEDAIYVLASGDGNFLALSPICTHRGCTVDVKGERLVCPCHGSTYDREGSVLRGPAERALTRYPVVREQDAIVIQVAA